MAYGGIITDQLNKGIIEEVNESSIIGDREHYIPHHAVISSDNNTSKIRIVYDGSAKIKKGSLSLNECLLRGPIILEDLCGLIFRFRTHEIAIVADIEKAFLQVGLMHEDRDVTRFLWIKDINKPLSINNLVILRFARVPFGIICSQFLLAGVVQHHLLNVATDNAKRALNDFYVDNLVTGVSNIDDAMKFYNEVKQMFKDMSMNLREWGSNSTEFLKHICEKDKISSSVMKIL